MALGGLSKMLGYMENSEFWNKIDILKANSYQLKQYSMHVSCKALSTLIKEYLLRLVFAPDLVYRLFANQKDLFFVPKAYFTRLYRTNEAKANLNVLYIMMPSI